MSLDILAVDIKKWTTVIQATSDAQKLFRLLSKLEIKSVYAHGDNHLFQTKKFVERHIGVYNDPNQFSISHLSGSISSLKDT